MSITEHGPTTLSTSVDFSVDLKSIILSDESQIKVSDPFPPFNLSLPSSTSNSSFPYIVDGQLKNDKIYQIHLKNYGIKT